jgi:hypothetical protein
MFLRTILLLALVLMPAGLAEAKRLRFSGYDFVIKEARGMGPGPNDWAASQVSVDPKGRLHLRLSKKNGRWFAGEVSSVSRFGFGTYEMEFTGDIGSQDKNVVFGFFNYPGTELGPKYETEIDIEFARWGRSAWKPLNFTVWPPDGKVENAHKTFSFKKGVRKSLHRFVWEREQIVFYSAELNDEGRPIRAISWTFRPKNFERKIGTLPMPLHFNLWGFQGKSPSDDRPVEVIIDRFSYAPAAE